MTQETAENTSKAEIIVQNRHGLHLRCASELARLACGFSSTMQLTNGKRTADAKSMLGLITLAAVQGSRLLVTASGKDAVEAVSAVCEYFTRADREN